MDNQVVICKINMFDAEQQIELPGGHIEKVPLEVIYSYLPKICYNLNIPKIHLFGNEHFCQGIAEQINETKEEVIYKNFDIEIEVN